MQREQLLLNSFLKKLAFLGCFNFNSKYEVLIILFSYYLMWTCDIVVGCSFVAQSYTAMWYGWQFRMHHVDERWTTCDSYIAYQLKEEPNGSEVDYVRIIKEILEVDFRSFKTLLLKVQWFCNNAQLENCLFCSIDTFKIFGDGRMSDQPFVFSNEID